MRSTTFSSFDCFPCWRFDWRSLQNNKISRTSLNVTNVRQSWSEIVKSEWKSGNLPGIRVVRTRPQVLLVCAGLNRVALGSQPVKCSDCRERAQVLPKQQSTLQIFFSAWSHSSLLWPPSSQVASNLLGRVFQECLEGSISCKSSHSWQLQLWLLFWLLEVVESVRALSKRKWSITLLTGGRDVVSILFFYLDTYMSVCVCVYMFIYIYIYK